MTKITYCITLSDRTICIDVPLAYDPWPWRDWPWLPRIDPRPEPWINDERLNPKVVQDLPVLATIVKLTDQLSPELSQPLLSSIKRAVEQIEVPTGVSIGV